MADLVGARLRLNFPRFIRVSRNLWRLVVELFVQAERPALRLLWLALALSALLLVIPSDPSLAHVAHFASLLIGMMCFRLWR